MNSIVIGSSSAIAKAIMSQLEPHSGAIISISSKPEQATQHNLKTIHCDYSTASMSQAIKAITSLNLPSIDRIYICNGMLHSDDIKVEKRLEDIKADAFMSFMNSNALIPILWLQALLPILRNQQCTITVFSARIGSISDNHLGGWYSYRASKAALNMLLKSASIEYAKRAKSVKLLAFHPGTTDTPLSEPFQQNLKKDALFTTEFVAERLESIISNLTLDGQLSFLDWQGKEITW